MGAMTTSRTLLTRALAAALVGAALLGLGANAGCAFLIPPESKVRAGELFETEHAKYDPYFKEVYALQQAAGGWDAKRAEVRRPLVDALKLDPDVADVTLVQSTHERLLGVAREAGTIRMDVTDGQARVVAQNPSKVDEASRSLFGTLETCARAELDRGKALRDVPARVELLLKDGRALKPQVREDLSRRGSRFSKEVEAELAASYDSLGEIAKSARLLSREAEDFVADLRRAVGTDLAEAAARPSAKAPKGGKPGAKPGDSSPKPGEAKPKPPEPTKPPEPAKVKPPEVVKPAEAPKPEKPEVKPEAPKTPEPPKPAKEEFNP